MSTIIGARQVVSELRRLADSLEQQLGKPGREKPEGLELGSIYPPCPACKAEGTPFGNKGLAACESRTCPVATFFFD